MESSNSKVEHIEKECVVLEKEIDKPIELSEENLIKTENDELNKIKNSKNNVNSPVVPQYGNYGEESSASDTYKLLKTENNFKCKKIIPLREDSLIDDLDKAQKQESSKIRLRRKKKRINENGNFSNLKKLSTEVKQSFFEKISLKLNFFNSLKSIQYLSLKFNKFLIERPQEVKTIRLLGNQCLTELLLIVVYCGLGAFIFRFTESSFENFYKCGVKRVKREFLDDLWKRSFNLKEDDWKSMARRKLMEFEEQLHAAHEAGISSYSGKKSWTFLNSVLYSLTVITTIGYGHIAPTTTTGRAITIVYAIFGIPMFLIILADFGKLFTRCIKFLWAFIRRLYYTGSCRKVRKTAPMQEVMKGVQLVYDLATFRRPSNMNAEIDATQMPSLEGKSFQGFNENLRLPTESVSVPDTPVTPTMSTFAIDDEFNLPISVAISILLGYIFIGATIYHFWEDNWSFFESFYFVFISMSTIGFGDYVPTHPIYMMCSIIYLVFGLALTSMCINVVQVMLSDHFKQASQKLGATIGLEVSGDGAQMQPILLHPVDAKDICTQEADSHDNDSNLKVAKSS
ncbi:potassium channel subfamily K member 18 isoform X1 [Leptopilina heterotoma]|uniref:potassium channel subfamily K member 18 isoform X1 n=1 Tax=Leptopilina heterotoma TaxID=63436 RepID=UPI001CA9619A|nr:potassium channel subfamily K member 18 isoform X1 [Leptopilina heterotoma]